MMMPDREKVINELRFQLNSKEVKEEHYPIQLAARDAEKILALLKEREPVKPTRSEGTTWFYKCGICGIPIDPRDAYCRECGRAIDWS